MAIKSPGTRPAEEAADTHPRGRDARMPTEIPLKGWWGIVRRVFSELGNDRVSLVAAGVGFFALLAAFPALAALVSLVSLFTDATQVIDLLQSLNGIPPAVQETLLGAAGNLNEQTENRLGFAALVGLAAAMWSAKKGVGAVMQATNLAYEEAESRPWWKTLLLSLAFTVGAILLFAVVLALGVALPLWLQSNVASQWLSWLISALQWGTLWAFGAAALAVLYRHAPDRELPTWRWVSIGSAAATTLWMLGSFGFSWYVRGAASYEETYGSLAGVVITLMWLYLTGYVVVLGAEINAEIEHQTARDTTVGPQEPMGQRGAFVADHVAAEPD